MNTNSMVQQILEGASPRDVIGAAVSGQTKTNEAGRKKVATKSTAKRKFKKFKKKRILTAAQKRAIRKTQESASKNAKTAKRRKSLKRLITLENDEVLVDAGVICPICNLPKVEISTDSENQSTIFHCPTCDADYSLVDNDVLIELIPDEEEDDINSDVTIDIAADDEVVDAEDAEEVEDTEGAPEEGEVPEGDEEEVNEEDSEDERDEENKDDEDDPYEDESLYFED